MEFKKVELQFSNLVTWDVFLIILVFVIITLTSAVFPNLLLTSFGGDDNHFKELNNITEELFFEGNFNVFLNNHFFIDN